MDTQTPLPNQTESTTQNSTPEQVSSPKLPTTSSDLKLSDLGSSSTQTPAELFGIVIRINGVIVDVLFQNHIPNIHNLLIGHTNHEKSIKMEVIEYLQDRSIRCLALDTTQGLARGDKVIDTNNAITVPVGEANLGHLYNVFGEAQDVEIQPEANKYMSIYNSPPQYINADTEIQVLETGIKIVDLFTPFVKGGKIGFFGGAGDAESNSAYSA